MMKKLIIIYQISMTILLHNSNIIYTFVPCIILLLFISFTFHTNSSDVPIKIFEWSWDLLDFILRKTFYMAQNKHDHKYIKWCIMRRVKTIMHLFLLTLLSTSLIRAHIFLILSTFYKIQIKTGRLYLILGGRFTR